MQGLSGRVVPGRRVTLLGQGAVLLRQGPFPVVRRWDQLVCIFRCVYLDDPVQLHESIRGVRPCEGHGDSRNHVERPDFWIGLFLLLCDLITCPRPDLFGVVFEVVLLSSDLRATV